MSEHKRIIVLDEARGFVVICMIIYHFLYSYQYVFHLNESVNLFNNDFMKYFQIFISSSFIFISGISSSKSKNILKRGTRLFALSILISIATYFLIPQEFIVFGILHFLGFSMISLDIIKRWLKNNFKRINENAQIMVLLCLFLLIICYNIKSGYIGIEGLYIITLPEQLYKNTLTSILGFPDASFRSADYFPIIPHIFLFYAGVFSVRLKINKKIPDGAYIKHSQVLNFTGRNSLIIYILHQPVIFILLYIYLLFIKNI